MTPTAKKTDCFWQGYKAFQKGKKVTDCPYPGDSIQADYWQDGYQLAEIDKLIGIRITNRLRPE